MADYWLINGKTALVGRRAKRRLRNKHRKEASMARHRRRTHRRRHHRNPESHRERVSAARKGWRRRSHRRYYRNPARIAGMGDIGTALLAGGAGYLASKWAGKMIADKLPAAIPARDLVGAGLTGALVAWGGDKVVKSSAARSALLVGALIPTVEAAVNMTSLGAMLGTQKIVMVPAPKTPNQSMAAALSAALSADLQNDAEEAYSGY